MLDGTHYFECRCGSVEHTLRFTLNKEDGEMYADVYLNRGDSFLRRLYIGARYIFGVKSEYGEWGSWVLDGNDADRLKAMCAGFIENDSAAKNEINPWPEWKKETLVTMPSAGVE